MILVGSSWVRLVATSLLIAGVNLTLGSRYEPFIYVLSDEKIEKVQRYLSRNLTQFTRYFSPQDHRRR